MTPFGVRALGRTLLLSALARPVAAFPGDHGRVSGRLLRPDRSPAGGVMVSEDLASGPADGGRMQSRGPEAWVRTAPDGRFAFEQLDARDRRVLASTCEGWASAEVTGLGGSPMDLGDVVLVPGERITGVVVPPAGRALAFPSVRMLLAGQPAVDVPVETGGAFCATLPAGAPLAVFDGEDGDLGAWPLLRAHGGANGVTLVLRPFFRQGAPIEALRWAGGLARADSWRRDELADLLAGDPVLLRGRVIALGLPAAGAAEGLALVGAAIHAFASTGTPVVLALATAPSDAALLDAYVHREPDADLANALVANGFLPLSSDAVELFEDLRCHEVTPQSGASVAIVGVGSLSSDALGDRVAALLADPTLAREHGKILLVGASRDLRRTPQPQGMGAAGTLLAKRLGADFVSVGLVFAEGTTAGAAPRAAGTSVREHERRDGITFQDLGSEGGTDVLHLAWPGPSLVDTASPALSRPVADWLAAPHWMYVSDSEASEGPMRKWRADRLPWGEAHDVLVLTRSVSPERLLPASSASGHAGFEPWAGEDHGWGGASLTPHPTCPIFIAGTESGSVVAWDVGRLAAPVRISESSSGPSTVRMSRVGGMTLVARAPPADALHALGETVLIGSGGDVLRRIEGGGSVLDIDQDAHVFAHVARDGTLEVMDLESGKTVPLARSLPDEHVAMGWSGTFVAFTTSPGTVRIHALRGDAADHDVTGGKDDVVRGLACSDAQVAIAYEDVREGSRGHLAVVDVASGKVRFEGWLDDDDHDLPRSLFLSAAFSPNGKLVAAGGRGHVLAWDVASGHRVAALGGDCDDVTSLAFSHDGAFLAAGGKRFLRCWRHGDLKVGESCACDVHDGSLGGLAKAP